MAVEQGQRGRGRLPLQERAGELRAILAAIAETRDGSGRVVLVRAPAGGGKTRLLDAAAAAARAANFEVLRATGSELERDLAFGGALALLERRLVAAPDDERAVLLGGSARVAGPLLLGADPTDAAAPAQMALVHALHWVCLGLAAGRPLALVVDDLHWVDRPSLHLVAYLARRVAGERVLLLLAARPHEPGAPQDLLDAIAGADDVTLLRPALLTPAGTAAAIADLLGVPPGDAFVAACAQATGGNPLLLQELVRALGPVQGTDADATRVAEVGPEPVARSVATTLPGSFPPLLTLVLLSSM